MRCESCWTFFAAASIVHGSGHAGIRNTGKARIELGSDDGGVAGKQIETEGPERDDHENDDMDKAIRDLGRR
jgi:hypothetical protein